MNPTLSDAERGKYVPWFIAAFFISFIIPLMVFTWIAFSHKPSEVTSHPYQKGLDYNQILQATEQQQALGWTGNVRLNKGTITFTLRDANGHALSGATVYSWLVRPSDQSLDQKIMLKEHGTGVYEGSASLPVPGLWELRITAAYEGKQLQVYQTVETR